jgi:hypothetical protein
LKTEDVFIPGLIAGNSKGDPHDAVFVPELTWAQVNAVIRVNATWWRAAIDDNF